MTPNPPDVGPRQAVVLIHGIGEQRPMATLRAFVEWLLPAHDKHHDYYSKDKHHDYYSKPDQISDSFELQEDQTQKIQSSGTLGAIFESSTGPRLISTSTTGLIRCTGPPFRTSCGGFTESQEQRGAIARATK